MRLQYFEEEELRMMRYWERAFARLFKDRIIFLSGKSCQARGLPPFRGRRQHYRPASLP